MASDADRIAGLYQRHAHAWDRDRARNLFERPWLDRFLALLPPTASILDVGCGGGEPIGRYLAGKGCRITGIDQAPAMIGICRGRFPHQEWMVADMRILALGRQFDGILAWDSLFHLRPQDQRRMFVIFARHAASRAALMFTSGHVQGESIGSYRGEPLYHASLDEAEYLTLLVANGFNVVARMARDSDCREHTVWLARRG